jgi:3-methyladenine DNA glycosylase AlkD
LKPVELKSAKALAEWVSRELAARGDPRKAREMAAYMKTSMPFYGVQKPGRAAILRKIKRFYAPSSRAEYERGVRALWKRRHREEKYLAVSVARLDDEHVTIDSVPLYEQMIREGAWWDFVDEIASKLVGRVLFKQRREAAPIMDRWIRDEDMWIRRSALLCQLDHKEQTDHRRLFRYCRLLSGEREFFIEKAIGWALRQYSYSAPDRVAAFLDKNRAKLAPLSFREGARVLVRQGRL